MGTRDNHIRGPQWKNYGVTYPKNYREEKKKKEESFKDPVVLFCQRDSLIIIKRRTVP